MGTPHLTDSQIERYRSRTLPADQLLPAIDHMFACDICHRRMVGGDPVGHAYRLLKDELRAAALAPTEHLGFEQIVAYAYGQLDEVDSEILKTHIDECPECEAEVADTRLFRATLHLLPPRGPAPFRGARPLPGQRLLYLFPLQTAAVLLIAFFAVRFLTSSIKLKMDNITTQVSQLRAANETLSMQLAQPVATGPTVSSAAPRPDQHTEQGNTRLPRGIPENKDPSSAITLRDAGRALRLDRSGDLESGGLVPAKYLRFVASALRTGHLSTPSALLGSLGRQTRSASENDSFRPISPVGVVTISDRPIFRWTPLNEAQSYSVQIRDPSSDEQFLGNAVTGTEWVPDKPLDRGHIYSWAIVATLQGGEHVYVPGAASPAAMFRVLDKSASDELEAATTSPSRSHLLLAVLYARNGLIAEAQKELSALQVENPNSAQITLLQRNLEGNPRR